MKILVSNDDGINSLALRTLVKKLSSIAEIYVVAPSTQKSGYSHHFNFDGRMQIEEKQIEGVKKAYALWGTPVDCVHAGIGFIFADIKFDLIVSGINKGWNVIADEIYSGTIACAREGYMYGVKSIALSLNTWDDADYDDASEISKQIIEEYLKVDNPNYFLSVNIPYLPINEIKGIKCAGKNNSIFYNENYYYVEEFGVTYLTVGKPEMTFGFSTDDTEIDVNLINDGYVTITPFQNDHIQYNALADVGNKWNEFKIK